ncbi:MAG: hypothetical protein U1E56_13575 [Bauldia sp.]
MASPRIKLPQDEPFESNDPAAPFPPSSAVNSTPDELEETLTTNLDVLAAALRRTASAQLAAAQAAAADGPARATSTEPPDDSEQDDADDEDGDVREAVGQPHTETEERTLETNDGRAPSATRRFAYPNRMRTKAPIKSRLADAHARGAGASGAAAAASARWEAAARVDLTNVTPIGDAADAERLRPSRGSTRPRRSPEPSEETSYDEEHVSDTLGPTLRGWSLEDDLVAVPPARYPRRRRSRVGTLTVAAVLLASAGAGAMVALQWISNREPVVTANAPQARTVSAAAAVERQTAPPTTAVAALPEPPRAAAAVDAKPAVPPAGPVTRSAAPPAAAPADRRDVAAAAPKPAEEDLRRADASRPAAPAPAAFAPPAQAPGAADPGRQVATAAPPAAAPAPVALTVPAVRPATPPAAAKPAETANDHPAWFLEDDPVAFEPPARRQAAVPGGAAPAPAWMLEDDPHAHPRRAAAVVRRRSSRRSRPRSPPSPAARHRAGPGACGRRRASGGTANAAGRLAPAPTPPRRICQPQDSHSRCGGAGDPGQSWGVYGALEVWHAGSGARLQGVVRGRDRRQGRLGDELFPHRTAGAGRGTLRFPRRWQPSSGGPPQTGSAMPAGHCRVTELKVDGRCSRVVECREAPRGRRFSNAGE